MFSPYSPFFTSGFLSSHRRGSLPTAFYQSPPESRSFLSLDSNLPLRPRRSRDSLRTIPSPKPAPSITLPDLPPHPPPSTLGLSLERASHSAPSLVISPHPSPNPLYQFPKRLSIISSSSVSTQVRKTNRSNALACLEGRSKPSNLPSPPMTSQKQNFMNMSDDEDDAYADSLDDDDPQSLDLCSDETEDMVFPPLPPAKIAPISGGFPSLTSFRSSHQSTKDWFPLKSFIDLRSDDDASAWTWRSWIEVATVS
ncbi:hypothetical protein L208DRAFT_1381333 [Tricholoma matsutake]|nr:hypothetical protein L208DRAFT_1381333 [Tricholoma matsutake 945]